MKAKTINAILTKRFESYLESITDQNVRKILEENSIITGGSIVSMLLNENVSDFDIYLRTPAAALAVAKYYVAKLLENPPPCFKSDAQRKIEIYAEMHTQTQTKRVRIVVKSAGIAGETPQEDYQYFENVNDGGEAAEDYIDAATALDDEPAEKLEGVSKTGDAEKDRKRYRVQFVTSNAITLANKMQIIIRFTGEPDQIHENYDFVHATNYWTSWDKKVVLRAAALESIVTRELRYVGSRYPICSLIRTRKFIKRGWTINAGQFVKMAYQVSQLDLTDVAVLEEQLVGVDAAYFQQLIALLQKAPDPKQIDQTYLMTMIDKLF